MLNALLDRLEALLGSRGAIFATLQLQGIHRGVTIARDLIHDYPLTFDIYWIPLETEDTPIEWMRSVSPRLHDHDDESLRETWEIIMRKDEESIHVSPQYATHRRNNSEVNSGKAVVQRAIWILDNLVID